MLRRLKNNEEHGKCLIIFNDGTKEHGQFKNGKRHGKYINESCTGQEVVTFDYNNGVLLEKQKKILNSNNQGDDVLMSDLSEYIAKHLDDVAMEVYLTAKRH